MARSDKKLLGNRALRYVERQNEYKKPLEFCLFTDNIDRSRKRLCPVAFYNSGKHLYLTDGEIRRLVPSALLFLPYKEFCHDNEYGDVKFRHLGHLFGIQGGQATVFVEFRGVKLSLTIERGEVIWLLNNQDYFYTFKNIRKSRIPGVD